MATVPTFDTFAADEVVTDVKLNKNIRDAGNYFRSPPVCVMTNTAVQSIPNNAATVATLSTVVENNDGMADLANNRIVIKTAGLYVLSGVAGFATNATGFRTASLLVGTTTVATDYRGANAWYSYASPSSSPVRLAVNDVVTLQVSQNSGAALNTNVTIALTRLGAIWVGV